MRLRDLLLDILSETALFEMAMYRKEARQTVIALSPTIFEHFIKLFVMSSPNNTQHWINEIYAKFNIIDDILLKPNSNRLTANEIYKWMIYDAGPDYTPEYLTYVLQRLLRSTYKGVAVHPYDATHICNLILGIIQNIVKDIEKKQFNNLTDYLPNNFS